MPVANDTYARLLDKLEEQQHELSALSADAELVTRAAYLQARDDIAARMAELIESRGGLANLSPRDRYRLTRDTGLMESVERRLTELGVEHQSTVVQAFTESGVLAQSHLTAEMNALRQQLQLVHGPGTPLAAAGVDFARLDTAAVELGLGTAINDTQNLSAAARIGVTRELQAGIAAGEGIPALTRRLDVIEELSTQRAEVISRWTAIKGYNLSRQAAYEDAATTITGLKKMWLTQADERACPHCLGLHGIVIEIADSFDPEMTYAETPIDPYQGFLEVPPLHPRCRCTITSWHESWRAYTDFTPEELHATAQDLAIEQGFPKATDDLVSLGVAPVTGIQQTAASALGDLMRGIFIIDDTSATVRIQSSADLIVARQKLRDAGFRVRRVEGADSLLRVDFPQGLALPRMVRSSRLRAVQRARWETIKEGILRCGLRSKI